MINLYNNNILWIKNNPDDFYVKKETSYFNIDYRIIKTSEDANSLLARYNNEELTLHSRLYPLKESKKIADSININFKNIIVIGLGLGYVVKYLSERIVNQELIVIEPDIDIFYLALKNTDLSLLKNCKFYIGYQDAELSQIFKDTLNECNVYIFKAQERLFSGLYQRIANLFYKKPVYNLSDNWKYKRFREKQCRIIFIDSSYVLTKECLSGIQKSGNLVHYIHINLDNYDYDSFFRQLLNDISNFKPDFVLTINHLGFDKEGRLTQLFNEMEMPFVSWFVDSPEVILSTFENNISDFCNIFVWDETYIPQVKKLGYNSCYYLPLATDTDIFNPLATEKRYNVSFVGSSMTYAVHKNMKSWVCNDVLYNAFSKIVDIFLSKRLQSLTSFFSVGDAIRMYEQEILFADSDQAEDFRSAVLWKATQIYRNSGLFKLSEFMPVVAGDPNWKYLLPVEYQTIPERWYYETLNEFYNSSVINFNMTSLQMSGAVNQRLFDVSASKNFILTDYRSQISELFNGKKCIAYFNDIAEIPELIKFYLQNEKARLDLVEKAYNLVLKQHTYIHRVNTIIDVLKNKYRQEI